MFATPSRRYSSRPLLQFLEALLLRKAAQTPMLTGKTLWIPSVWRRHSWRISFWSSVVDMTRCRDEQVFVLFTYINGADSYTELQLIVRFAMQYCSQFWRISKTIHFVDVTEWDSEKWCLLLHRYLDGHHLGCSKWQPWKYIYSPLSSLRDII